MCLCAHRTIGQRKVLHSKACREWMCPWMSGWASVPRAEGFGGGGPAGDADVVWQRPVQERRVVQLGRLVRNRLPCPRRRAHPQRYHLQLNPVSI